ncbi:MAG: glutathione S-transferase family protein [Alphaproteobacteria bacterium]|nr:MAG: glutathione S-transferase family protein [Alphaproteobacteria bacterium]
MLVTSRITGYIAGVTNDNTDVADVFERVLYHSWLDGGSRLVRIVLAEKRLEARLVLEKPWERRAEFLRLNPAGTVPVLIEGRRALADAIAIAEYLDESQTEPPLLGADPVARAEVRRLVGWFMDKCDREVTQLLVGEKLYRRFLRMGETDSAAIRAAHHNLKIHLDYIGFLCERRHYLAGGQFSLADAAAAAHVSIIDYFGDIAWDRYPAAKDWYMRVKSRRAVRQLLADRIAGLAPPRHYEKLDF